MIYGKQNFRQIKRTAVALLMIAAIAVLLFTAFCPSAGAVGLVDDTVDAAHEYSRYPLENYQLDFYVDNGWDWLPWNWIDGIGKQVMYGLYCITNFIWTINLYLSNASGYLVQEAYSLNFISDAADEIGRNIQSIAGISPSGLFADGFYAGFLLLIILIVGAYVAYTGLIKRETTKAVRAVMNMVLIFVLSGALIAYAPDCVKRLNEFSEDVSTASLSVGTKIVLPDVESSGADSVELIRDSLFSIQVKQPWLLLQFGDTDMDAIGTDRVESLLSASPSENNGEDRENAVKAEIEDNGNTNLTVTKTVNRLGTVFFPVPVQSRHFGFRVSAYRHDDLLAGAFHHLCDVPAGVVRAQYGADVRGQQQARGDQAVQYDLGAGGYYACYHGGFQHFHDAVPHCKRLSVLYHCVFAGGCVRGDLFQAGRSAQHVFSP